MTRREFEASFRYAPFGFKFLPAVHSFWVFFDCTFLDNSNSKRFCVMQNERIRNVKKWIFVWLVFGCKRTDAPVEKRRSADWRMVEKCRKRECFQQNNA